MRETEDGVGPQYDLQNLQKSIESKELILSKRILPKKGMNGEHDTEVQWLTGTKKLLLV